MDWNTDMFGHPSLQHWMAVIPTTLRSALWPVKAWHYFINILRTPARTCYRHMAFNSYAKNVDKKDTNHCNLIDFIPKLLMLYKVILYMFSVLGWKQDCGFLPQPILLWLILLLLLFSQAIRVDNEENVTFFFFTNVFNQRFSNSGNKLYNVRVLEKKVTRGLCVTMLWTCSNCALQLYRYTKSNITHLWT